jgi:4-alpha-glucanotransferase
VTSKTAQVATTKKTIAPKKGQPVSVPEVVTKKKNTAAKKTVKTQPTAKKPAVKVITGVKHITFQLRFHTSFGQDLLILGNHPLLGNGQPEQAVPMQYFNEEYWVLTVPFETADCTGPVTYHYLLRNADGSIQQDWGNDKSFDPKSLKVTELHIIDTWNYAGYFENAFYTEPFTKVLLRSNTTPVKVRKAKSVTHILSVKTPLLQKGQTLCVLGSGNALGFWDSSDPLLMTKEEGTDFYRVELNLHKENFPIAYKYGVYDTITQRFVRYEDGNNRILHEASVKDKLTMVNDGFAVLPNTIWKGAGVAIPVFSIRTEHGLGVGEFTDLKKMVDWAVNTGLKMIQLLPVNDTTATHSWTDSYPYAAISAFALHPLYLNLDALVNDDVKLQKQINVEKAKLNALPEIDYEAVIGFKTKLIQKIYTVKGQDTLSSEGFQEYFAQNKHWLQSYAAFCYLRDQYGTVDFNQWPAYRHFNQQEIDLLTAKESAAYKEIALHYYVQYQLHVQLKEATAYAHDHGIIVKGDIAIGVYRHGADAWQHPELYHMDAQAGAPPDDFAVAGQNWGFPTYNWQQMQAYGFAWWKQRFEQMSYYFDAFRIDHILGFFRIWSIPMDAVEGILGRFVPAIPVHINEFQQRGISFDHHRFTKPFINDNVLWELFGYDNELVKKEFLDYDGFGHYTLKPAFATQRQVEAHFQTLEQDEQHEKVKKGLYNLISNVILLPASETDYEHFHFRIGIENTSSYRYLDAHVQGLLKDLYVDYFYRRQDEFWRQEALQKLPALKRVTNMLICGEDLGMVPDCVPDVMKQLGLLSLEIQRMPKDPKKDFFHPNDAPYLSVVTPSTHDMSTIRGWWEEDPERIQQFYNHELGQWGEAPAYCEAWINQAIVLQHLYSPAMWSVFQLQDLVGISAALRREDPHQERINIPANPKHYWRYRMHLSMEELMKEVSFTNELKGYIEASGRS